MSKYNKSARKPLWVSQNFLVNSTAIRKIIQMANIQNFDHVIEIGPGKGYLTGPLLKKCGSLTAVELDSKLAGRLSDTFSEVTNFSLIQKDFLKWTLPTKGNYMIFSNIPFSITTSILQKITTAPNPPKDTWLIMELGAARRFTGTAKENKQSLLIKPFFVCSIRYHFSRQDFRPSPGVDTVLLHLHRKEKPDISPIERKIYENFITTCFTKGVSTVFTKKQWKTASAKAGIIHQKTHGTISYIQWLCLFRCYQYYNPSR